MASTGKRMLDLLTLLQSKHRWRGDELTKRLKISERTLRRDVDRLRSLGYPVHADRGIDGGYRLGPGTRLPPLLVNEKEAVAVAVGLRHAASLPIASVSDAAISVLTKVADLLPAEARRKFESAASSIHIPPASSIDVSFEVLSAMARASRDSERVRFCYRDAAAKQTARSVEPHSVAPIGQRWYLIAWDLDRDDWRIFRLDRISDPHVTKRRFDQRTLPAADAATFVAERLSSAPAAHRVDVVVSAPADQVQSHLGPWGSAEAIKTNSTRIRMDVDDLNWVVLILAAINADIQRAQPPELLERLHTLGARFSKVPLEPRCIAGRTDS